MSSFKKSLFSANLLGLALVCFVTFFLYSAPPTVTAAGATYYMSPSGIDTNPGTSAQPVKTLKKALSLVQAGDTVIIRNGTYKEIVDLTLTTKGTANAPITVKGETPGQALFDASGLTIGFAEAFVSLTNAEYYNFENFSVINSKGKGLRFRSPHNVNIRKLDLSNNYANGLLIFDPVNSVIEDCIISWNVKEYTYNPGRFTEPDGHGGTRVGGWPSGFMAYNSTNTILRNNKVFDNDGEGIICERSCTIQNNEVYNNRTVQIYTNTQSSLVEKNLMYAITRGGAGFGMADEKGNGIGGNNIIRNNVIIGTDKGISVFQYMSVFNTNGDIYEHNTIINTGTQGLRIRTSSAKGMTFRNNIVQSERGVLLEYNSNLDSKLSNNIFYSATRPADTGKTVAWNGNTITYKAFIAAAGNTAENNQYINPQFIGTINSLNPQDYRIKINSPAINAGGTNTDMFDFNQYPRTSPPDIGAFEYETLIPLGSPTPTTSPSPTPSNTNHCQPLGDIDCSGSISTSDLNQIVSGIGQNSILLDLDNSTQVNTLDYGIAYTNYQSGSPTPVITNIVRNGSFDDNKTNWTYFTDGTGQFDIVPNQPEGNAATIAVNTAGTNEQLYQTGISLIANTRYRLTFNAYSSTGNNLKVSMIKHTTPYTNYGLSDFTLDLTTQWQTFTTEFTTTGFSGSTIDTRLRFFLNGSAQDNDHYFIDSIVLNRIE
ncbi:hypothetical protein HGA91_03430 [candidate division WWE3 bacterium]|nr:hypothetical protein [candidate division WWE3 bacterium]